MLIMAAGIGFIFIEFATHKTSTTTTKKIDDKKNANSFAEK